MKVNVKYMGLLKLKDVKSGNDVELIDGTTISDFLQRYVAKKEHHKFIIVTVNEKKVNLSYQLQDQQAMSLFLPFGGG